MVLVDTDDDCHHHEWAKEMTPAGIVRCRICNPKSNEFDL